MRCTSSNTKKGYNDEEIMKLSTFKLDFKSTLFSPTVLHDLYKEQKKRSVT